VLQYRADTVSADSSFGEPDMNFWLWPWYRGSRVLDAVDRHDAQVQLHYIAGTLGWFISPYKARVEYTEGSLPVDNCIEYEEWPRIRELQRELDISLRLKSKVDELKERGRAVNWDVEIEPPYLDEATIDALLAEMEVAERLKPIADALVQRASQIDWDMTRELKRNPYDEQQIEVLKTTLIESESLHPTVVELRSNLAALSWNKTISPPYNSEQITKRVQDVDDTMRLKDAMSKLFARADAIGWSLVDSPFKNYPYTDENHDLLKQQLKDTETLVSNVQKLVAEAKRLDWDISHVFSTQSVCTVFG
jgi:hypothetical protein